MTVHGVASHTEVIGKDIFCRSNQPMDFNGGVNVRVTHIQWVSYPHTYNFLNFPPSCPLNLPTPSKKGKWDDDDDDDDCFYR